MERLSVIVFLAVSIFFFVRAIKFTKVVEPKIDEKTRGGKMISQGMLLSILNIFPIPFYIGFSPFLASRGLFNYVFPDAYLFIVGAVLGTFLMLYLYARYIQILGFDTAKFAKNTNYSIAALTFTIAVFTAIRTF